MRAGYAATKWAMEAIAETLSLEAASFGIDVVLVEPGAVATEGVANAGSAGPQDDPYAPSLATLTSLRADPLTVAEVAAAVADAVEDPHPPLRVPVGEQARRLLDDAVAQA
jgi:NAD(P)-dependent dehydrogenase (short-subunit alcohol dehydrogenase family)